MRVPAADTQLLATSIHIRKGDDTAITTSSLDRAIWTTCKQLPTTWEFLPPCLFTRFFKLYGNCIISGLSTQTGSGMPTTFSKRHMKSNRKYLPSKPGFFPRHLLCFGNLGRI
jgi:hypothetical protein